MTSIQNDFSLPYDVIKSILDNAFDEIFVYDNNYKVLYVNRACERHYGMKPSDMIGKTFWELLEQECWYPSVLPTVYKEKRRMTIEQRSYLGESMITTAVPIFDDNGEIELVVMSVRDKLSQIELTQGNSDGESPKETFSNEDSEDILAEALENSIISRSDSMDELLKLAERVSKFDSTIMIRGESGTGKGVLAKYIHKKSNRSDKPILTINCAAIPEELLESELFGYVKGAFTGASESGKIGLLELADQGTLFLDEIGELSQKLQAKLLHVIQEKQYIPIGGRQIKKVDIRIIAATNRDLMEMVEKRQFREDLYWRLNVIEIEVPPLRERPKDIIALSNYFLNQFNEKYNCSKSFSEDCIEFFTEYPWPGNVRQLENMVERLVVTTSSPNIRKDDLPSILFKDVNVGKAAGIPKSLDRATEEFESDIIKKAYKKYKTSRMVAKALGISQSKASRLISKYCSED